jgi:hypothetical protein
MNTITKRHGQRSKVISRAIILTAASGLLVGLGAQAAFAGYAQSAYGYFTSGSQQYMNYAYISTSNQTATAVTSTQFSGGGTQIGWAGSRGRLFTSSGALRCESTNQYNGEYNYPAFGYSCNPGTSGAWYGYGVSLGWNGGGYQSFYTFQSPNQNS